MLDSTGFRSTLSLPLLADVLGIEIDTPSSELLLAGDTLHVTLRCQDTRPLPIENILLTLRFQEEPAHEFPLSESSMTFLLRLYASIVDGLAVFSSANTSPRVSNSRSRLSYKCCCHQQHCFWSSKVFISPLPKHFLSSSKKLPLPTLFKHFMFRM